jgi:hypothetical protein
VELVSDEQMEIRIRLEAALDGVKLSSERLKTVMYSGHDDAIEAAYTVLRLARMGFLKARADSQETAAVPAKHQPAG